MKGGAKISRYPDYLEGCPTRQPPPLECILALQRRWGDYPHFELVDVRDDSYEVRLSIPQESGVFTCKRAVYKRRPERRICPQTGYARWFLMASNCSSSGRFYRHELEEMGREIIQVGDTIPTAIRGLKVGQETYWTADPQMLDLLRTTAQEVERVTEQVRLMLQHIDDGRQWFKFCLRGDDSEEEK